ncbi:hypothetical protein [Flexivirga sp. B27]
MTHPTRRFTIGTIAAGTVLAATVAGAPTASAAEGGSLPHLSAAQERAAVSAAAAPGAKALLQTATRNAAARQHLKLTRTPAKLGTHGTPVYALSASFVRGTSETPGQLWYVATSATTGAGKMTLFTAPDKTGKWRAVNVASGNTEARMAAAADGASVLVEPQVGAWYAVAADRVRPLNKAATQVVGSAPVSVADYQQLVHDRYADKQAGSAYDKRGTAGGFSASATSPGADTHRGIPIGGVGFAAAGLLVVGAAGVGLKRRRA